MVLWRFANLFKRIKLVFDLDLQEEAVGRLLKKLGYSSMSGCPLHLQSDLEAQEVLKILCDTGERRHGADRGADRQASIRSGPEGPE